MAAPAPMPPALLGVKMHAPRKNMPRVVAVKEAVALGLPAEVDTRSELLGPARAHRCEGRV